MITNSLPLLTLEEEQTLVQRAQNGDQRALDRLLESHYQQMYYLASNIPFLRIMSHMFPYINPLFPTYKSVIFPYINPLFSRYKSFIFSI